MNGWPIRSSGWAAGTLRSAIVSLCILAAPLAAVTAPRETEAVIGQLISAQQASSQAAEVLITHGVASGDVTAQSAVIWARANRQARMLVEYDTDSSFPQPNARSSDAATEATDYTANLKLDDLAADAVYYYRVSFFADDGGRSAISPGVVGTFRTAPEASTSRPVSFVFGGDLGGSGYCRRVDQGYAIFSNMQALSPDFSLLVGDMIYADHSCPANGPEGRQNVPGDFSGISSRSVEWTNIAQVREVYRKHWRYNRADPHFQGFLQSTSMYSQWDDQDVIDNFGASWAYHYPANSGRAGYANIVAAGRDALFNYSPIDRHDVEPNRMYRSFNWGRDLDVFILDNRSYRSRNDLADTPENNKTMLGSEQVQWLKDGLLNSAATWKVISSSVPLSIPSRQANAVDGWANGTANDFSSQTGFERELLDLLKFVDDNNLMNIVFVATDVHFAANIRCEKDFNGDGDTLVFHELISGPLSTRASPARRPDPTLQPTVLYAEGQLFNFGYVRVEQMPDGKAHLIAEVRGEDGQERPGSLLDLTPG